MARDCATKNIDLTMGDGSIITIKTVEQAACLNGVRIPSLTYTDNDSSTDDYIGGRVVITGPHYLKENDDGR